MEVQYPAQYDIDIDVVKGECVILERFSKCKCRSLTRSCLDLLDLRFRLLWPSRPAHGDHVSCRPVEDEQKRLGQEESMVSSYVRFYVA